MNDNDKDELTTIESIVELGICLAVCMGAAVIGVFFSPGEWYDMLAKPSWTPPDDIFPWVWSILYITMGIALWLIWRQRGAKGIKGPLLVFILQLLLNAAWSYLFFGLHMTGLALIDAIFLTITLLVTVILFWRVYVIAGVILLPYLLWMIFAVWLNFMIWHLNF